MAIVRKLGLVFLKAIFVLFFFIMAIMLTLPWTLPAIATFFLEKQGFLVKELQVDGVNWQELQVHSLLLSTTPASSRELGATLDINLQQVQFNYTLSQLVTGKINTLEIDKMDIVMEFLDAALQSSNQLPKNLINFLPKSLVEKNPILAIELNQGCLTSASIPVKDGMLCLSLTANFNDEAGSVQFELSDKNWHQIDGRIELDSINQIDLTIESEGETLLTLKNKISNVDENLSLHGSSVVDFNRIHSLLAKWNDNFIDEYRSVVDSTVIEGKLEVIWQGSAPKFYHDFDGFLDTVSVDGQIITNLTAKSIVIDQEISKQLDSTIYAVFNIADDQFFGSISTDSSFELSGEFSQFQSEYIDIFPKGVVQSAKLQVIEPIMVEVNLQTMQTVMNQGALQISVSEHQDRAENSLAIVLKNLASKSVGSLLFNADYQLKSDWGSMKINEFQLRKILLNTSGRFEKNRDYFNVYIDQNSMSSIGAIESDDLQIKLIDMSLTAPFSMNYFVGDQRFSGYNLAMLAQMYEISSGKLMAKMKHANLIVDKIDLNSGQLVMDGDFSVKDLLAGINELSLLKQDWSGEFSVADQEIHANILAEHNDAVKVTASLLYEVDDKKGRIQASILKTTFTEQFKLSQAVTPWNFPFDVYGGEVFGDVDVSWGYQSRAVIQNYAIKVENLSGDYQEILFDGLYSFVNIDNKKGWQSVSPAKVSLNHLDVGVPIRHLELTALLGRDEKTKQTVLTITDFDGQLLGGNVTAKKLVWNSGLKKNTFPIEFSNIKIEKIIELEAYDGLAGNGAVDGFLPIVITEDGVSVEQGRLTAREPGGNIQYQPSQQEGLIKGQNDTIGYVLKILKNFQYNALNAHVNYSPDGKLTLPLALRGKNSDVSDRPIHLNLNLELDLLDLLKSLQLADKVGENLGDKFVPK